MKKIAFIFLLVLLVPASGCYAKGPWRGKVIDAETKQPIEGAAVVAVWEKEWAGLGAGAITKFLNAAETITDKNGNFEISPKYFLSIPYFRKIKGPYLTIYKPGYGSFPLHQVSPQITPENLFENKRTVVELPTAKSWFDREKYLSDARTITEVPDKYIPKFNKLKEKEYNFLFNK